MKTQELTVLSTTKKVTARTAIHYIRQGNVSDLCHSSGAPKINRDLYTF